MRSKTSPLFSLMDTLEYQPSSVNRFEDLGDAPCGERHIAVYFRNVLSPVLHVDYKNPIRATKHCTVYHIVNAKRTVYGLLFVIDRERYRVYETRLVVQGDGDSKDFSPFPYTTERLSLSMYRNSADTLLVNIGDAIYSEFVVLDE